MTLAEQIPGCSPVRSGQLIFIYIAAICDENLEAVPMILQLATFVGMMTNVLLGVYSIRSRDTDYVLPGERQPPCG